MKEQLLHGTHRTTGKTAANAYLIAASPRLLKALENCMWMIESFDGTSVENEKLIDEARAAVEEAQGGL